MGDSNFLLCLFVICSLMAVAIHSSAFNPDFGGEAFLPVNSECRGTIAECLMMSGNAISDFDGEFAMDSETNRRILTSRPRFISYDALLRDYVPCSHRGLSYYNCQPSAFVNPYTRGCNTITRCRS